MLQTWRRSRGSSLRRWHLRWNMKEVREWARKDLREEHSRQTEQQVQRAWGKYELTWFEQQQGGPCGYRGARGRVLGERAGEVMGQMVQGLTSHGEDSSICLEWNRSQRGFWVEEGHDLAQVRTGSVWPLWGKQTIEGTSESWETKEEVTALVLQEMMGPDQGGGCGDDQKWIPEFPVWGTKKEETGLCHWELTVRVRGNKSHQSQDF